VTTSSLATSLTIARPKIHGRNRRPGAHRRLDNSLDAMIEQIFGRPKPELIARWRKIHEFFDEPRLASLLTTFGYA
jgi:hypothetical protein